ncbi:hypothetical protein [Actinomycetospora sp. CA-084318]|uniref:hypothetical protein n=1 Tax=Actinomycetospora sp. CA-084318 TaxID=3239892 RepID=UPI003D9742BA
MFAAWAEDRPLRGAYRLDWRPDGSPFGATHCLELPLLLGDRAAWWSSPMLGTTPWPEVDATGRDLRAVWAGFARTGRLEPAAGLPVAWAPDGDLISLH